MRIHKQHHRYQAGKCLDFYIILHQHGIQSNMLVSSDHSYTFIASGRARFRFMPTTVEDLTFAGSHVLNQEIVGSISPCFLQLSTCPASPAAVRNDDENFIPLSPNSPIDIPDNTSLLLKNSDDVHLVPEFSYSSHGSITDLETNTYSEEPEAFRPQGKDEYILKLEDPMISWDCKDQVRSSLSDKSSLFYTFGSEPTFQECTTSWSDRDERCQELVDFNDIENFQQNDTNLHDHKNDTDLLTNQEPLNYSALIPQRKRNRTADVSTLKRQKTIKTNGRKRRRASASDKPCMKKSPDDLLKASIKPKRPCTRRSFQGNKEDTNKDEQSLVVYTRYTGSDTSSNFYNKSKFKDYPKRTFPLYIPIHEDFPRFYARAPRPSFDEPEKFNPEFVSKVSGILTTDLYSPRYTRGRGAFKEALCPLCVAPNSCGGEDKHVWLKTKCSAYWYHMNFYHGISSTTKKPFSPPTDFKLMLPITNTSTTNSLNSKMLPDRSEIIHGYCHECEVWIPLQGPKDVSYTVPELFWFQHAKKCHKSCLDGEKYELWDDKE